GLRSFRAPRGGWSKTPEVALTGAARLLYLLTLTVHTVDPKRTRRRARARGRTRSGPRGNRGRAGALPGKRGAALRGAAPSSRRRWGLCVTEPAGWGGCWRWGRC